MPSNELFIKHVFTGGWASDFGPSMPGLAPDQTGMFKIPFLIDAEDVLFDLDGGPLKVWGTSKLNSSALESGATMKGIFDYWRQGTGGSPTQKRLVHVGTKIYKDDADGSFSEIKSGLVVDAVPNYATFDDLAIIASDSSDVPMSYDQTTFQDLAGSPPNFAFSVKHKNFHFAAGIDATPSRLHYSSQLNPEEWTGGTSGTIDIDPNDGDRITGLISWKNELWVFKGPYKGSIHRITGTSNADWARTTFISGVGAVWQNSIFPIGDDIGFLWSDGSIRTLRATDAFGDFRQASLSAPIQKYLTKNLNFNRLRHAVATTDGEGQRTYITVPAHGSSTNNRVLVLDNRFDPPRWSLLVSYAAASIALVIDSTQQNKPLIYLGGYDGFVRKSGNTSKSIDGSSALSYKVTIPYIDYGAAHKLKNLNGGSIGILPRNNGDITFGWTRDSTTQQTQAITQQGYDVLGTAAANQFTLGTSKLGDERYVDVWFPTETGGEFRTIQYQFTNAVLNEDVEIHSFNTFLVLGGVSMEN